MIKDEFGAILEEYGLEYMVGTPMHAELSKKASKFAADMLSSASDSFRKEEESWRCAYQKLYEASSVATNRSDQLARENIRLASGVRRLKAAVYLMIAAVWVMLICLWSTGITSW